jgi:hypothetical protein
LTSIKDLLKKNHWWDVNLLVTSFCNRVCICNQIYQLPKSLTSIKDFLTKNSLVRCYSFGHFVFATIFAFAIKFINFQNRCHQRFVNKIVNGMLFFWPLLFATMFALLSNLSTSKIVDIKDKKKTFALTTIEMQLWVVVFFVSFHSFLKCVPNMDTINKVLLCETKALYKLIVSCVTRLVQNIIEN